MNVDRFGGRWLSIILLAMVQGMLLSPMSSAGQTVKYMHPPEWVVGQKLTYWVVREGLSDCLSCGVPIIRHHFEMSVTNKKVGQVFDTLFFRVKVDSLPTNSQVPVWSKTGNGTRLFHREQMGFWSGEIPEFMHFTHLPRHQPCIDSAHFARHQNELSSGTFEVHIDTLSTSMGLRKAIASKGTSSYSGNSESRFLCVEGWGNVYAMESEFHFPSGYKQSWVLRELVLPNQSPITMDTEAWYTKVMEKPVILFKGDWQRKQKHEYRNGARPYRIPLLLFDQNRNAVGRSVWGQYPSGGY